MPVVKVTRTGVRSAAREVPTDTTLAVLPMTLDRVGQEAPEDEVPTRVSSLAEAFDAFQPKLDFRAQLGEEATEFVAELEFRSLKDFEPGRVRSREPGRRNDLADLQSRIDLLHRMRERFTLLAVKRAWDNDAQRQEIIAALAELQANLRLIADQEGAA
jgi:type VI secretion system protein ImpB